MLKTTKPEARNYAVALWAGFLGGNLSSFVKWGTENPLPPRTADRAIPPAEMLQDVGFKVNEMIYHYSGHIVNWGVAGIHHLFSIGFAMFYCLVAEVFLAIKRQKVFEVADDHCGSPLCFGVIAEVGA